MRTSIFVLFIALLGLFSCQSNSTPGQQQELPSAPNNKVDAPEILTALFTPIPAFSGAWTLEKTWLQPPHRKPPNW
ncbi:MAG: hypothetical protein IPL49_22020 [Saprospirales bacterium]|nr:hypothetical protein [Saprospirales bacterium]